jgi:hypothetical protein
MRVGMVYYPHIFIERFLLLLHGNTPFQRHTMPERGGEPRYCKFDVQDGRASFRASILVRQEGVGSISALPAEQ